MIHYDTDEPDPMEKYDDAHCELVIEEILDAKDVYMAAPGPEGPWQYKSLVVQRRMNRIFVFDVDAVLVKILRVAMLADGEEAYQDLRTRLDALDEPSLEAL